MVFRESRPYCTDHCGVPTGSYGNKLTLTCVPVESHIVDSCPLTRLAGGLSKLHSADDDAVACLTNWQPIEDAHDNNNISRPWHKFKR